MKEKPQLPGDESSCKTYLRLEAVKEEKIAFKAVQEMWGDFLPLLMDTEQLISQYKGKSINLGSLKTHSLHSSFDEILWGLCQ